MPLIVVAPGYKTRQQSRKPTQLLDIFPTLLELAGLPADGEQEDHSLVPLMNDPQAEWSHVALSSFGKGNHAVRSEHLVYIHYLGIVIPWMESAEELREAVRDCRYRLKSLRPNSFDGPFIDSNHAADAARCSIRSTVPRR